MKRSTAIYFAKQAFDHHKYRGKMVSGFCHADDTAPDTATYAFYTNEHKATAHMYPAWVVYMRSNGAVVKARKLGEGED